ncbi:MAG: hypothetical protein AB7N24_15680 [Dehalococcoidia bacterium]
MPDETPDTAKPLWHVPYVNQDRVKPSFVGLLNGIRVDPSSPGRTALEVCPEEGMKPPPPRTELEVAMAPGPLRINVTSLPRGVAPTALPDVFLCKGTLGQIGWSFNVAAGTDDVNRGGSALYIHRIRGLGTVTYAAPEDRWSETAIHGVPGIIASPIVVAGEEQFGGCFLAVYDNDSQVLTTVSGLSANAEFCVRVAEALIE